MPHCRISDLLPTRAQGRALLMATLLALPGGAFAEEYINEADIIDALVNADMNSVRMGHDDAVQKLKGIDWSKAERIQIEFDDNWFEPESIQLKIDQPYRIMFQNIGYEQHDIIGEEFFSSVLIKLIRNESMTVESFHIERLLVPPRGELEIWLLPINKTTLDFACTVPGHLEEGMIGSIEIID